MNTVRRPSDYSTLPLEEWTVTDLTDALTVVKSAEILKTSLRAIYTIRNTNVLHVERTMRLIDAVRANEEHHRRQLTVIRNAQFNRAAAARA